MKVFTLRNAGGLEARVTDYGGIILSLLVPDRDGRLDDVVLGLDAPEDYIDHPACFGALIGRFANRIARGRFRLDGRTFSLARNQAPHHLHGGRRGFHTVVWDAEAVRDPGADSLVLRHTSPAGDEGYPGTLNARVRYTITDRNQLVVDYQATTDEATPVNLTHHSYFNLAGHDAGSILDHVLTIDAARFTPVDPSLVPTGELRNVAGTPFDFREPTPIGDRIHGDDDQLRCGAGYDHNFVLDAGARSVDEGPALAARLHEPVSGRTLEVHTTEPGLQLYTGNGLSGPGKGGVTYGPYSGLALETQHFPDSPNQPHFPSTILRPGETHRSRTVFAFGASTRPGSAPLP